MGREDARAEMVEIGRRLWLRGYVAANDGNLSVRLGPDRLLTTPTGVSKGFLDPDELVITDLAGRALSGSRPPSSELKMHLEVYRLRPEVGAIVHAHPPIATAFALAGLALDRCLLPESVLTLGAVPLVPYGTPSTDEVPQTLRPFISRCDAVLLANHGAVTWADTLPRAYYRMETLEHTAAITHHALQLGRVQALDAGQVGKLQAVRERLGLGNPTLPCQAAGVCPAQPDDLPALVERIVRLVLEAQGRR